MSQANFFDVLSRPRVRLKFSGSDYSDDFDRTRLTGQLERIYDVIRDERWRTLQEIGEAANAPPASVSAQLRNLRKEEFGSHVIEKRSRGDRAKGLFEYRLNLHPDPANLDTSDLPGAPVDRIEEKLQVAARLLEESNKLRARAEALLRDAKGGES